MKKLLYTFLAASIIFSACKKEDEEPTNNSSPSIIGAWTINTLILESNTSSETLFPEDIDFATTLDFRTGGILYEHRSNGIDTNEWAIVGDSLYIGEGGEHFRSKHEVTNTNLTLRGPIDDDNMWGADILIINATRD